MAVIFIIILAIFAFHYSSSPAKTIQKRKNTRDLVDKGMTGLEKAEDITFNIVKKITNRILEKVEDERTKRSN
jgi:uncharacterized protein YpmB